MQLSKACTVILDQLSDVIHQVGEQDYIQPSVALSGSSIGQHLRHTLEFFICLEQGFASGIINYDKRAHDKLLETDLEIALMTLARIRSFVNEQVHDAPLKLEVGYDLENEACITIETNYYRELTYNIEHAVHHMAIMKIGIREVAEGVVIPTSFGVATSTIRYREQEVVSKQRAGVL